jgi:signal transduction histidine kinase
VSQPPNRPSAALVIGWIAGLLSAVMFVLMLVPLVWEIIRAEQVFGRRHTTAAALSIEQAYERGVVPTVETMIDNALEYLAVQSPDGTWQVFGEDLSAAMNAALCAADATERSDIIATSTRQQWAISCIRRSGISVIAGVPLDPQTPARRVFLLGALLALFVGIVTALGIVRVMQPLSDISGAIQRVGGGERGVVAPGTGLAELDVLVDRLNAAARFVDEREDAIESRIALVQEMARIVAHEIRNPLQSLELLTTLVVAEEDGAERKAIGASIHTEVRTLEQVVNRLLRENTAAGWLRLQLTRQSIAPLVEHVVALRRPQASANGVKLIAAPLSQTQVPLDQMLVKRSIENLVLNALQAAPTNFGEVRIAVVDEAEHVLISVDDNGPGVSAEMESHLFEPNVSGRPDGTGLGLALVKGVMEAHSGYITYGRSALGGARFEARIPHHPPGGTIQPPGAPRGGGEA